MTWPACLSILAFTITLQPLTVLALAPVCWDYSGDLEFGRFLLVSPAWLIPSKL